MDRSESLQPLSHDHHYGLLAARRLTEKLADGDDGTEIAGFARRLWSEHLKHHFEQEEAHVVPALRTAGAGEHADRILREHESIREQIRRLSPDGSDRDALAQLAGELRSHARYEEREAFPALEERADDETLQTIGEHLHREAPESRWEPSEWP